MIGQGRGGFLQVVPDAETAVRAPSYGISQRDRTLIEEHLDWYDRTGVRPATLRGRRQVVEALAALLPCDLLAVTPRMLDEWQSDLVHRPPHGKAGKVLSDPGHRAGTMARATAKTYTAHVRGFYRWAAESERTGTDLARKLPRIRPPAGHAHPVPEDDLLAVLAVAEEPVRTFIVLAAFLGLRAAEIAGITGEAITVVPGGRLVLAGMGKGAKPFRLVVPRHVEPVLRPFLGREGPVFIRPLGTPAIPSYVTRVVSEFFKAQAMPYTCHWLRHSFGTAMYQQTKDLLLTQELLRHESPTTTQIYVETAGAAATSAADELAARMLGGGAAPAG